MGNIQASKSTLYSRVIDSQPAHFAKDKPVLAGAGATGAAVIVAQAASHSELVATTLEKGVVPAVAVGGAILGASMVKDAIQNDLANFTSKDNNTALKFLGKAVGGTALTLAGTEVAGRSALGVSPLGKAAELVTRVIPAPALGAGAISLIPASIGLAGASAMHKNGLSIGNAAAMGIGATGASLYLSLAVSEATNYSGKAADLAFKGTGVVGGAALGLGAVALGKDALNAAQEGNSGRAVLAAVGATTAGAAAVHVLGNATGIEALSNLGQKVFLKNPLLAGSITAVAMAGAGYYMYAKGQDEAAHK